MEKKRRLWYALQMVHLVEAFQERSDDYDRELERAQDEIDPFQPDLELFEMRGMFKVLEHEHGEEFNGEDVLNSFGSFIASYPEDKDDLYTVSAIVEKFGVTLEEIEEAFDDIEC